jgi:hypothetical protein
LLGKRAVRRQRAVNLIKNILADAPRRTFSDAFRQHTRQRVLNRSVHIARHNVVGRALKGRVGRRIKSVIRDL